MDYTARSVLALGIALALLMPADLRSQQNPPAQKYKIEILSAAGNPKKRKKNVISSESVIRVTDRNDVPVAGATVTFLILQLSGGSASFANGSSSTIVTTNPAGIASTGELSASPTSSFNISTTASISGQTVTESIPVSMVTVAAGIGAGAGVSGLTIGLIVVAVAAGAAVAAGVALSGGNSNAPAPGGTTGTPPTIRIGGPGTPVVGAPRP